MQTSEPLTGLEKVSPLVLESFLRNSTSTEEGDYADEATKQFMASNCPRFENFSTLVDVVGTSSASGKGLDVQMYIVHKEYCDAIENKIIVYLKGMNVEVDRFRLACSTILKENNPSNHKHNAGGDDANRAAVMHLVHFIEQYQDFLAFGRMMEQVFLRLHYPGGGAAGGAAGAAGGDGSGRSVAQQLAPSSNSAVKAVRVLWDIENIAVPKKIGGVETVKRIKDFLKSHGLSGIGIDSRIAVFFNPSKISKQLIKELDAASVELVWISNKVEDADRKLVARISQEMAVLPAASTTFVLISSDKDFRSQLQILTGAGYCTIVVHNATHGDWRKSLEMHSTQAYQWRQDLLQLKENDTDILGDRDRDAPPPYDATGPNPSKHRREIDRAAAMGTPNPTSQGKVHADSGSIGPSEIFSDFLCEFGVSQSQNANAVATSPAAAVKNGNNNNSSIHSKGSNPSQHNGRHRGDSRGSGGRASEQVSQVADVATDEVVVRFVTGGTAAIKSCRLFSPVEQKQRKQGKEITYLKACVLRWKGPFGFLAIPISKTEEEIAAETLAATATASVSAGDAANNGASSAESIHAVRRALRLDDSTSAATHLVKIYAHHSALQLEPHRDFLSRGDVCRVVIGPNPKGPTALKIFNPEQ